MAKKVYRTNEPDDDVDVGPQFVQIDTPADGTTLTTSNVEATGIARPSNARVFGTLTNKTTGAATQSDPPFVDCVANASGDGVWSLVFPSIPPGDYLLSVNEGSPNEGADANNITVQLPIVVVVAIGTTTSTSVTATVSNNSPTLQLVSAVIVASKPKHGDKKHKLIAAHASDTFRFTGLTSGTDYVVTAFAVGAIGQGDNKPVRTP